MKAAYARIAAEYGVKWNGRRYDRANPTGADIPNQAINHAASAVEAIAAIAVNAVSAIPQLGFIHEHSAQAFVLDIADLFRNELTLPIAFAAALEMAKGSQYSIDRIVRYRAGRMFREKNVAGLMIEKIKELFDVGYDGGHNAGRSRQVPRVSADDLRRDSAGSVHRAADIPGGQKQDLEGDGGVA
jgi:CRISPR-associated protein Cas1